MQCSRCSIIPNLLATGYGSERILITEYFNAGSLKDFLNHNEIDPHTLVRANQKHIGNKHVLMICF